MDTPWPSYSIPGVWPNGDEYEAHQSTCSRMFMAVLNVIVPKGKAKYPLIVIINISHFNLCAGYPACLLCEYSLSCTFIICVFFWMYG